MKIKFNLFELKYILLFSLFFRPGSYIVGNFINTICNYIVLLIIFIYFMYSIYAHKHGYRYNYLLISIWILFFWITFGSSALNYLNGNSISFKNCIVYFFNAFGFSLICDLGMWKSQRLTIKSFLIVGIITSLINVLCIYFFGDSGGMNKTVTILYNRLLSDKYFYFGEDNACYFWTFPTIVMLWNYYFKYKRNFRFLIFVSIICFVIFMGYVHTWSVLAMLSCILTVLLGYYIYIRNNFGINIVVKEKVFSKTKIILVWTGAIAFNILISLNSIISLFASFIKNYLKKDITLSGRTKIWAKCYKVLSGHYLIGFGSEPAALTTSKIGINIAHNLFLETLYRGGIIGLILFISMLLILVSSISYSKDYQENKIINFNYIIIFIFLIFSSIYFAFYRYHYLIILLFIFHFKDDMYMIHNDTNRV